MKKNNFRRCLISKKVLHKKDLVRFIIDDTVIKIDLNNNLLGRGYYISKEYKIEDMENFLIKKYKKNIQK